MTKNQQKRALELFESLLDQPDAVRATMLQQLTAEDEVTARKVAALIAVHEASAGRLPTEPPQPREARPPDAPPPAWVGVYRITAVLGRGGMGEVYRAERSDGLFDHVVAIKLMRPAHSSTPALRSFEIERSHLARLHHPNIAQLFDGGNLPDGRAYIVMELVEGGSIVEYVRAAQLATPEILSLFISVCSAVQAAHQNLIVHADLKPSNILVGRDGVAKLLDFGVSRLLAAGSESSERSAGSSATALTAAYASPERRRGHPPNITDDIYSLGVILEELLYGRAPVAPVARLVKLPKDLNAIIGKAKATCSEQRYCGVNEMLADLNRYQTKQPVSAREPTVAYRLHCFVRRYRIGVAAAGVLLAGLLTAVVITSRLYAQAESARLKADQRFTEVRQLANFMLGDLQSKLGSMPQSLTVRKEIVARGEIYMRSLAVDDSAPPQVQLDAIAGLTQLAEMQGAPGKPNIGDTHSARLNLQRALTIVAHLRAQNIAPLQLALATARIKIDQAAILVARDNDTQTAQERLIEARKELDAATGLKPGNPQTAKLDLEWTLRSADVANWASDYQRGAQLARLAIDRLGPWSETDVDARDRAIELARAWDTLAEATYYRGDFAESAVPYQREIDVVERARQRFADDSMLEINRLRAYWSLGTTLLRVDRNVEALQALTTGTAIGQELLRREPDDADVIRDTAITYAAYGQALAGVGRYPEAIKILAITVRQRAERAREHPEIAVNLWDYAISLNTLADVHALSGDTPHACKLYAESRSIFEQLKREGRSVALTENHLLKQLDDSEAKYCGKNRN